MNDVSSDGGEDRAAGPTGSVPSVRSASDTLRFAGRVRRQQEIGPGVFHLTIDVPGSWAGFRPGQCVSLGLAPEGPGRYYSLANGNTESTLAVLYDLIEEGELTPLLSRLHPGEEVWLSAPFGSFTDDGESAVWIATGTGIAPFLSMARSMDPAPLRARKLLVHGGRSEDRFYFADELHALLGSRFIRCCSQCTAEQPERARHASVTGKGSAGTESFYRGRLTHWLRERMGRDNRLDAPRYYLCGSSAMVVQVRDILIRSGVPFGRIRSEIYF